MARSVPKTPTVTVDGVILKSPSDAVGNVNERLMIMKVVLMGITVLAEDVKVLGSWVVLIIVHQRMASNLVSNVTKTRIVI